MKEWLTKVMDNGKSILCIHILAGAKNTSYRKEAIYVKLRNVDFTTLVASSL
tara:strand:- start:21 stop:176 length:156 start_codon:yes stop_codon:yes gene_type:complete